MRKVRCSAVLFYHGSDVIDNYNSSAFYETSYFIARAYNKDGF